MNTGRRHPWLGVLVVIAACVAWMWPSLFISIRLLRELYQFGEQIGITPTAASGAGSLGGQIGGFNFSRPPRWYGFAAMTLTAVGAFAPVLLPALWVRRRLSSGRVFVGGSHWVAVMRDAASVASFGIVFTVQPWHHDLFMGLVRLFERLGATTVWIGALVKNADGPFVGGTTIDTLGNYAVNLGPRVIIIAIAAGAAAAVHALLWRGDVRRAAESGRCAGCGYDLAGIPAGSPCPECGRTAQAIHGRLCS